MDEIGIIKTMESNETASNLTNTTYPELPPDLKFNDNALLVVIIYSILFVIAAIGNLTVFVTLIRGRHRKSRISLMITHLAIADLFVTFVMIPLEIGWRLTTQWVAGNVACKFFLFLRAFGLYLSSNVLVCVSVDRYFAILHPLKVNDARRRGKTMLALAWMFSLICALPQSVVFHVSQHPQDPNFWQCVSFGFFTTQARETAYNLFCVSAMYFLPLLVIIVAYTCIMCEIVKKTRETKAEQLKPGEERVRGRLTLRRSDMTNIERARSRTLRMTLTIVVVFIWCWTPYVVMTLWYSPFNYYKKQLVCPLCMNDKTHLRDENRFEENRRYMFDRESAIQVDSLIQDGFFMMAVSNSCMNPVVYGSYAMNFRRECRTCFCFLFHSHEQLHRKSTAGSGATRSTGIAGYNGSLAQRSHLTLNKRPTRPASVEHLVVRGRMNDNVLSSDEFHSDPGAHGVYLVAS